MDGWKIAIKYHELKAKRSLKVRSRELRKLSAASILERAQQLLGSIVRPVDQKSAPMSDVPFHAPQLEIDLEETIENTPSLLLGAQQTALRHQDIWMNYEVGRPQQLVLCVDTSLSMTGEKLALTAVSLAMVLLEFPDDPIGVIAFENEAKILKRPAERISIQQLVERFLDVPAHGYTHLEDGLKAGLRMLRDEMPSMTGQPTSTILVTDGKYTAGKDPTFLAPRFPHLIVVKMGTERASFEFCRNLAHQGNGVLREVNELSSLPAVMYGVVKEIQQ